MKTIPGIILGALIGFVLVACTGDSDADGGNNNADSLTETEVNALIEAKIKDYETRIATLEAALENLSESVNVVVSADSATARLSKSSMTRVQKLADAEAIGCSFSGYLPENQLSADTIQCKTPAGYLFNLAWPGGGAPLDVEVWYEQPGCMGTAYALTSVIEDGAREQGAVVSYFDGTGKHLGMVVAGSPIVPRTVVSLHTGDACHDGIGARPLDLVEIVAHDPEVTQGLTTYPAMTVQ